MTGWATSAKSECIYLLKVWRVKERMNKQKDPFCVFLVQFHGHGFDILL